MTKFKTAGNTVIRLDASAGGALTSITAYVDSIDGVGREFMKLDTTQFTNGVERIIPGIEIGQEFGWSGAFDDAATTGPDAILSTAVGTILSFEYNPAGTTGGYRKITMEIMILSYKISAEVKGRVNYTVRAAMDGAATIGAN